MGFLLVVVQRINQHGVAIFKGEGHAPVAVHRHRMKPGQIVGKAMQPPAWKVHVLRPLGNIQSRQQAQQLLCVVRLISCSRFSHATSAAALGARGRRCSRGEVLRPSPSHRRSVSVSGSSSLVLAQVCALVDPGLPSARFGAGVVECRHARLTGLATCDVIAAPVACGGDAVQRFQFDGGTGPKQHGVGRSARCCVWRAVGRVAARGIHKTGTWAINSVVECHLHTVEVSGSNPLSPTTHLLEQGCRPSWQAFNDNPRE
jgi:hypothetical protein